MIFEDFAYFMISEAREIPKTKIFEIGGNVYAFDSTTIDLCLAVFWWAQFRKKKGDVKVHIQNKSFLYRKQRKNHFCHDINIENHAYKVRLQSPYVEISTDGIGLYVVCKFMNTYSLHYIECMHTVPHQSNWYIVDTIFQMSFKIRRDLVNFVPVLGDNKSLGKQLTFH